MKLFKRSYDGGPDSGVTGYWLIEWKRVFSIVLLHFSPGSCDAYHSHAFNAITWWLKGNVEEQFYMSDPWKRQWKPSLIPKWAPRQCFHRIIAGDKGAWALSFRGPWTSQWQEHKNNETYNLTHGRKPI